MFVNSVVVKLKKRRSNASIGCKANSTLSKTWKRKSVKSVESGTFMPLPLITLTAILLWNMT